MPSIAISQDKHGLLFDFNSQPVWIYHLRTLKFLAVNDAAVNYLGYSREEFLSMSLTDILSDESILKFKSLNGIYETSGSLRLKKKDGSFVNVNLFSEPTIYIRKKARLVVIKDLTVREDEELVPLLSAIVESSDDAIIGKDLNGIIRSWNKGAENIYGYTEDEVIGKNISILVPENLKDEIPKILKQLKRGEKVDHYETIRKRKDGRILNISVTISPIKNNSGKITGASAIARDITEKKKIQAALKESEKRFQRLSDSAPVLIWAANRETHEYYYNERWKEYTGPQGIKNEINWEESIHPEDREDAVRIYREGYADKKEFTMEYRFRKADGEYRWLLDHGIPRVDSYGNFYGFIGSCIDITNRKAAEKKSQENKKRLHFLLEASNILNSSLDYNVTLSRVAELMTPDLADWSAVDLLDENGKLQRLAVSHVNPEKIKLAQELAEKYPTDPDAPTGAYNVIRTGSPELYPDIPEEMLKKTAQSEEHYNLIKELGLISGLVVPLKARNKIFGVLTLASSEESGKHFNEEDLAFVENLAQRASIAIDNSRLLNETQKLNSRLAEKILNLQTEVKERKAAEQALKESEELFRQLAETIRDVFFVIDFKTKKSIYISPAFEEVWGYTLNEYYSSPDLLFNAILKADQDRLKDTIIRFNETGNFNAEYRILDSKGNTRWVKTRIYPLKDNKGNISRTVGITENITERKKSEEEKNNLLNELNHQRIRMDSILSNVPGVVWEAWGQPDASRQKIDFVSDYVKEMLGYSIEEWISTPNFWFKIVHPEDKERAGKEAAMIFKEKKEGISEFRWIKKDGAVIWVEAHSTVIKDKEGKPIGMRGVTMDISSRKMAEERFKLVVESSPSALIMVDSIGKIKMVNSQAESLFGYKREELMNKSIETLIPDRFRGKHPSYRDGFVHDPESRPMGVGRDLFGLRKDGAEVPIEIGLNPIKTNDGLFILSSIVDITERKKAETALFEQNKILERLNDINSTLAGELEVKKVVQHVTDSCTKLSKAEFGAFFYNVIDEQGEGYTLFTISGVPKEHFTKFPMPRNTDIFGPTFRGEAVVRLDDVTKDERFGKNPPYYGMPKGHLPVKSYLAIPVISRRGKVLGGLFFGHSEAGVFTERSEKIIVGVAAQAAIAIDNAGLFKEAQNEISERIKAEKKIEESLREKEVLLKEIHHRVKNNMQIISSLLNLQLRYVIDEKANEAFLESQNRIRSMALVHEKLYGTQDLSKVNFKDYVNDLIENLLNAYQKSSAKIKPHLNIEDIKIDMDLGINLGLVINELVSNSIKHGFPGDVKGDIWVELKRVEDKNVLLSIRDNGPGIPEDVDISKLNSLGLQLVFSFVSQIDGTIEVLKKDGAHFNILFPLTKG